MKISSPTNNPPLFRVCYYIPKLKRWDVFSTDDISSFSYMIDALSGLQRTFRSESFDGTEYAILESPSSSSLLHSFSPTRLNDRDKRG